MIKARLAKWEYIKNAKKDDWGYLAVLHEHRKQLNKPTAFEIRGHKKTVKDLQRFIRNQNSSPEQFVSQYLDDVRAGTKQIPDYIRAFTPDPDSRQLSPDPDLLFVDPQSHSPHAPLPTRSQISHQSIDLYNSPDAYSPYEDPANSDRNLFRHKVPYESNVPKLNHFSAINSTHPFLSGTPSVPEQSPEDSHPFACHQLRLELEACSDQLLRPMRLVSKIGSKDMRYWTFINARTSPPGDEPEFTEDLTCSRCHQSSDSHFASLDNFDPMPEPRSILNDSEDNSWHLPVSTKEEGSWLWISRCFLACMYLTRGDERLAQAALQSAADEFERRLRASDSLLLTAAGLMITILHTHDQGEICQRILENARAVTQRMLQENNPIRVTIEYLTLTANTSVTKEQLGAAGFTCERLEQVYHQLQSTYQPNHPYAIAAHHNYSWLLKFWNRLTEAEQHAREVHRKSKEVFKAIHMQSIMSSSVIAGCLVPKEVGRTEECIAEYTSMITNARETLGITHPYVLEAQRRLGDLLTRLPDKYSPAAVLKIQKAVLFGRAKMLGRRHRYTLGQRQDYEAMLRRYGKWADEHGRPSPERAELEELFTKGPEDAWVHVREDDIEIQLENVLDPYGLPPPPKRIRDEEWSRVVLSKSMSRSTSPTSTNEYESY